jgi:hypothetical protein
MKRYEIKALLHGSTSTVWREIIVTPDTSSLQLSDILLVAFGWEDCENFVFTNERGTSLAEDEYYPVEQLVAELGQEIIYQPGDGEKLRLSFTREDAIKGQLALPVIADGGGDDFDFEALNAELKEIYDPEDSADFLFEPTTNAPLYPGPGTPIDTDAETADLPLQPEWLEAEHGIKVSEENVRGTPADILEFRARLTEADLATPRAYLRKLRPIFEKHPEDPLLNFEMAGLYGLTGEGKKSRQLLRKVSREFPDNLEVLIHRALSMEDEMAFTREIADLPRPLDIRNHPAGKDGYYQASEFLGFEEMAIRAAVIREDLGEARHRLDRLVRFGFLHGDVEQSAIAIAALQLEDMPEATQSRDNGTPHSNFPTLCARTNAILNASTEEVLDMMRAYEENTVTTVRREGPKVGRNDPCPCGSGKKFKKCCG